MRYDILFDLMIEDMGGFHAFAEGDDSDSTHSSGGDLHFNGSAPHVDADDAAEGDSSAPQVDGDRNQHGQPTASSAKQPVAKPTPVKAVKIADKVAGVRRRAKQLKWKLWESASAHDSQGWMDGFILLHPDKYMYSKKLTKHETEKEVLSAELTNILKDGLFLYIRNSVPIWQRKHLTDRKEAEALDPIAITMDSITRHDRKGFLLHARTKADAPQ